eukprot:g24941.t1
MMCLAHAPLKSSSASCSASFAWKLRVVSKRIWSSQSVRQTSGRPSAPGFNPTLARRRNGCHSILCLDHTSSSLCRIFTTTKISPGMRSVIYLANSDLQVSTPCESAEAGFWQCLCFEPIAGATSSGRLSCPSCWRRTFGGTLLRNSRMMGRPRSACLCTGEKADNPCRLRHSWQSQSGSARSAAVPEPTAQ